MREFFHSFRFRVDFFDADLGNGETGSPQQVAGAAFSGCEGLEATMETHEIKEGGWNYGPRQRAGRTSFATVVLKRGMSADRGLWRWFEAVAGGSYAYRLNALITVLDPSQPVDHATGVLQWELLNALPMKYKAAGLDAASSEIAIEELHLNHEGLKLRHPAEGGAA